MSYRIKIHINKSISVALTFYVLPLLIISSHFVHYFVNIGADTGLSKGGRVTMSVEGASFLGGSWGLGLLLQKFLKNLSR